MLAVVALGGGCATSPRLIAPQAPGGPSADVEAWLAEAEQTCGDARRALQVSYRWSEEDREAEVRLELLPGDVLPARPRMPADLRAPRRTSALYLVVFDPDKDERSICYVAPALGPRIVISETVDDDGKIVGVRAHRPGAPAVARVPFHPGARLALVEIANDQALAPLFELRLPRTRLGVMVVEPLRWSVKASP